jgi:hypothetical protein
MFCAGIKGCVGTGDTLHVMFCAGIKGCVGTSDTLRVNVQKVCFFKVYVLKILCSTVEISGVRGGAVSCGRKVAGSIPDGFIGVFQ